MFKRKKKDDTIFNTNFTYKDLTAMEEYLELKHQNGLELTDYTDGLMTFKKCEPSEMKYSCEVFLDKNRPDFDPEFVETCEAVGWKYVATDNSGLYIFRSDDGNAADIMTDEKMKLSIIAKSYGKLSTFMIVVTLGVYLCKLATNTDTFFEMFASPIALMSTVMNRSMVVACFVVLIRELLWFIKRKAELKRGEKLKLNNLKSVEKRFSTIRIIILIWFTVEAVFSVFIFGELGLTLYLNLAAYVLIFIFMCDLIRRKPDIGQSTRMKDIVAMAVSIAVFALSLLISFVALPPVPNETDLSEKIVSEIDIDDENKEVYVSRTRFAQYYDSGWDFEMFVSRNSKLKDKYLKYMIDYYSDEDPKYTVIKKQIDDMIYYEFTNTEENYTYELLAVKDDRVLAVHSPQENTVQIIYGALAADN